MSLAEDMEAAPEPEPEETRAEAPASPEAAAALPPPTRPLEPKNPGPAYLRGPDGDVYHFADPRAALATGEYRRLSTHETVELEVERQERAKGLLGSLEAGGKSALNQALFGVPGAIEEETETPEEKERRLASEKYHSAARMLGGAVGVGASLLTGGELFKAADLAGQAVSHGILPAEAMAQAGLGARLAARGAELATQGAVLAAPQALVQSAFGDPGQAAETLLWGMGTGAIMGGAGELLSSAGRGAVGALDSPGARSLFGETADRITPKAIGADDAQLRKLTPEQVQGHVDFAHDEQILRPGMTRQEVGKAIDAAHTKWGLRLDDVLTQLDGFVERGTGKEDLSHLGLRPGELGDALRKELDTPEIRWPMNADQKAALDQVLATADRLPTRMVNGREVVSFQDAQMFVSGLRKKWVRSVSNDMADGGLKGLDAVTPLDRVKSAAYRVARDTMHAAGDRVALAASEGSPQGRGLVGALAEAKRAYQHLSELDKWAAAGEQRAALGQAAAVPGMFGMAAPAVGAAIGGALGGGPGALVGALASKVPQALMKHLAGRWAEDRGLVYLAATLKAASREGPDAFAAVLSAESRARLQATLSTVGTTIRKLAQSGLTAVAPRGQQHLSALLGSTVGRTPDQSFRAAGDRLAELAGNPSALAELTSTMAAPLEGTAPQVGAAYQQKMAQAVAYLNAAYPRAPSPPPPFAPQTYRPSEGDKLAWHDRVEIVTNPMAAVRHMHQGTLTPAHVEALQTVYPGVYALMRQEVLRFHAEHPHVLLPIPERQSVARFLGVPLGTPDDHAAVLQDSYKQTAPGTQGGPKPTGRRAAMKGMPSHATTYGAQADEES